MSQNLLERILDRIDALVDELADLKVTMGKQEENLRTHMKRSDMLEESLNGLRKEVEPIKRHVAYVEIALKLIGGLAVAAGLFESVKSILGK